MGVDTGGRNDIRQRRAFQKLAADAIGSLNLIEGFGIIFDDDKINISLRPTDPGLSLTGGLGVLLNDTDPGLSLTGGLAVAVAAGEPFGLTGGLTLSLASTGGLEVDTSELGVKLDTDPGLGLSGAGLTVVATPGGELEVNPDGIDHAYPPGRFTDIDKRTTIATGLEPTPGQFVLLDSSTGTNQSIFLPDPTTCGGEHITVKCTGDETIVLVVIAQLNNSYTGLIEGIPANPGGSSFITLAIRNQSFVVTSDGVGWWFTSNYLGYQEVNWKRYRMYYADRVNESGATMEIPLFTADVNQLESLVFEKAYIHTSQGWFTANSGVLDVEVVVDDDNSGSQRSLIPSNQLWPYTYGGSFQGRTSLYVPDLIATGEVTVKAVFTVSGGTTDITDVSQGQSTVWLKWGNIGPRFN